VHLTSIVGTPAAAVPVDVDAAVEDLGAGLGVQGGCLVQGLWLRVVQPCSDEVSVDDVAGVTLAVADGGAEATNRVDISRAHQRLDSDGRLSGDGCLEADPHTNTVLGGSVGGLRF
jgi:hypothetical protein